MDIIPNFHPRQRMHLFCECRSPAVDLMDKGGTHQVTSLRTKNIPEWIVPSEKLQRDNMVRLNDLSSTFLSRFCIEICV